MIRIGVDAWNLPGDRRGIGRYLREILRSWSEEFADRIEPVLIVPEWHTWTVRSRYLNQAGNRPYRIVSRRFHARARLDALWFPFNGCSWTDFSLPAVATLHDASNFTEADYDEKAQTIFVEAARRCRRLVTVSQFARDELARELQIDPERFDVIAEGVAEPLPAAVPPESVASLGSFVLYVGSTQYRKGFDLLLDAMREVQRVRPGLALATTGDVARWADKAEGVDVRALGFVDDATLAALYRSCTLLAFPSRYEGFGLPVLEAMSYGAPVVASDAPAVVEAGGDVPRYVPSGNVAALAAAIEDVAGDESLTRVLRPRGIARAKQFSWTRTAGLTLEVFESMLAEGAA